MYRILSYWRCAFFLFLAISLFTNLFSRAGFLSYILEIFCQNLSMSKLYLLIFLFLFLLHFRPPFWLFVCSMKMFSSFIFFIFLNFCFSIPAYFYYPHVSCALFIQRNLELLSLSYVHPILFLEILLSSSLRLHFVASCH